MTGLLSPLRAGRITGSRVSAILGLSKYSKPADVLREMVRQQLGAPDEFTGNVATAWGNEHEDDALAAYEVERAVMVHAGQEFVIHPEYPWLAATPDGLVGEDGMVEAKCPYRAEYMSLAERPDYAAQIQLQMECTGREWCDFLIWRPNDPLIIDRAARDRDWLPSVAPLLMQFVDDYTAALAAPEVHLAPKTRRRKAS